jgi:hypothetical protein
LDALAMARVVKLWMGLSFHSPLKRLGVEILALNHSAAASQI